jgi:hypothetical protein
MMVILYNVLKATTCVNIVGGPLIAGNDRQATAMQELMGFFKPRLPCQCVFVLTFPLSAVDLIMDSLYP